MLRLRSRESWHQAPPDCPRDALGTHRTSSSQKEVSMKNDIPDSYPDCVPRMPAKPMIVRCSHCNGLMRVDEDRIRGQGAVRVRCPHCRGVGIAPQVQAHEAAPESGSSAERNPGTEDRRPAVTSPPAPPPNRRILRPRDPSEEFRFPAETGVSDGIKPSMGFTWRILIWLIASIGVVGAFALLVNLMLPGPPT